MNLYKLFILIIGIYCQLLATTDTSDVTFWGATPNNNLDDDFAAFKNWSNWLNTHQPKEGFIPKGYYKFIDIDTFRTIQLSNNAPINGNNATIYMGDQQSNCETGNSFSVKNSSNTIVQNLILDGEYKSLGDGAPQFNVHLISFYNCKSSGLQLCTLKNSKAQGASFEGCTNAIVSNCTFQDNGDFNFTPDTNQDCEYGRSHALHFTRCVNTVVDSSNFYRVSHAGVQFWLTDGDKFNNGIGTIQNCYFEDCAYYGIIIENFNGVANVSNCVFKNNYQRTSRTFEYGGIQVRNCPEWNLSNLNSNNLVQSFVNTNDIVKTRKGTFNNCNFDNSKVSIWNISNEYGIYQLNNNKIGSMEACVYSGNSNFTKTMHMHINNLDVSGTAKIVSPPRDNTTHNSLGFVNLNLTDCNFNLLQLEAAGCENTTWHIEFERVNYQTLDLANPQLGGYDIVNKDNIVLDKLCDMSNGQKDAFPFNDCIYQGQGWRSSAHWVATEKAAALANINNANVYNRTITLKNGFKYWIELLVKQKDQKQQEIGPGCNLGTMYDAPSKDEYQWLKFQTNKWVSLTSPAELMIGSPTWLGGGWLNTSWFIKAIKIYKIYSSEISNSHLLSLQERNDYQNNIADIQSCDQ